MHIPFHKTHTTEEEIEAVADSMRSGWLTMGPKTVEFEAAFKDFVGAREAVSMNSATAALHLALKATGLQRGDEVIVPTNTFVATAEVVTYFDAVPVLCDIEEETFNIDVSRIEDLITEKTKAIIPVHFAGQPCDMDEIYAIAGRHDLKVIEDAAHALPSEYKGQMIGSLAGTAVTCFSFYATKTLSTGEGGMATTDHPEFARIMKVNRLHGISRDAWDRYTTKGAWFYEVIDNGNKYNTTDMNAALGLVQLRKQVMLREKRAGIAQRYHEAFSDNPRIIVPQVKADRITSWHLYVIRIPERDRVIEQLKEEGIGSSVHFIPIHKHPFYREKYGYRNEDYPIANKVFDQSLSLPIYPDMREDEVDYVIEKVREIVG